MNGQPSIGVPPLAGLATYEEAAKPGLAVDENVKLLRRCNFLESCLYRMCAAFINSTPEWEVKQALSFHLYLDGEHSQSLRQRVAELRKPPLYLDKCPDSRLESLINEALRSSNTIELLVAFFGVLRPALIAAYEHQLELTNPIFDYPTCRILRTIVAEERQMVEWGTEALRGLIRTEEDRKAADDWELHLRAYLVHAGTVSGLEPAPEPSTEIPQPRANSSFVPDLDPKRDWRSKEIYNFQYRANDVYLDDVASWDERALALMFKRVHEMDVPEVMAGIIVQTPNRPWEYYRDMGRQLWDEARHAMMGEVWFTKIGFDWSRYPNHVGWSMHLNLDRTPLERHIILYFIEQSLMDGKTGKRLEWKIAQSAGDPLATYFQDYDWADEVLHAQIGRRWLKPEVGDVKNLLARAKEIAERPSPSLESKTESTPQRDWWPEFVEAALGRPSTAGASADNRIIPKFKSMESG
jgi:hypothetical protein